MEKTALLFSGQGSQCQGMGKELYDEFDCVKKMFATGNKVLSKNPETLCFETDNETLTETVNAQPAIFTVSLSMLSILKQKGFAYDGVCGFSLGEVAALVAADILTVEDGFVAIDKRASLMQKSAERSDGGMAAIIGLDTETVEKVCADTPGYVIPVNYNCPGQLVIAGENAALSKAIETCLGLKAMKAVRLAVGSAFHSRLMADAADSLAAKLAGIAQSAPTCELYSNVTGELLPENTSVPEYLKLQMTSPVQFEKSVRTMLSSGYTRFLELGSGKVLTGLVKRISRDVQLLSFADVIRG